MWEIEATIKIGEITNEAEHLQEIIIFAESNCKGYFIFYQKCIIIFLLTYKKFRCILSPI